MTDRLADDEQTEPEFLAEIKGHIGTLREELEKKFPPNVSSYIHKTIQQNLQQAETACDQALRNFRIDAEMAAKKALEPKI